VVEQFPATSETDDRVSDSENLFLRTISLISELVIVHFNLEPDKVQLISIALSLIFSIVRYIFKQQTSIHVLSNFQKKGKKNCKFAVRCLDQNLFGFVNFLDQIE
jgi:hypothetical protein